MLSPPKSNRLKFKILSNLDIESFFKLVTDNHIQKFLMEGQKITKDECLDIISKGQILINSTGLGLYLIYYEKVLIGYCGFMETRPPSENLDIIYALTSSNTGHGFATEACQALITLFQCSNQKGKLTAVVHPKNSDSIKVLEKNNFESQGYSDGELSHLLKYMLIE